MKVTFFRSIVGVGLAWDFEFDTFGVLTPLGSVEFDLSRIIERVLGER